MVLTKSIRTIFSTKSSFVNIRKCATHLKHEDIKALTPPSDLQHQRLLKVAVIGMPNSGKSSFINQLMDRKVCPVSSKVHTTRHKACAIFTENDTQIVFLDSPGLVTDRESKKYKLEKTFVKDGEKCLQEADMVGVLHDVSNFWVKDRLDIKVINLLGKFMEKPSVLILNKVDLVKSKRKLLDITRVLTENCIKGKPIAVYDKKMLEYNEEMSEDVNKKKGWPYFSEVFMVSALTGSGLAEVKQHFIKEAKCNSWMFSENVWSDQTMENIILSSVKAKLLNFLPQELPYLLHPHIEFLEVDENGAISTVVLVKCPSERIKNLVAGAADGRLRQIIENVQEDLQDVFQAFARIRIVLEVSK